MWRGEVQRRPRRLCVVVPCLNEQEVLPILHERLATILDDLDGWTWQVVFVDDGSTDATPRLVQALANTDGRVKLLTLEKHSGQQAALAAGMDAVDASADAVLCMDADLQHPPELIPHLLHGLEEGHDCVMAVRASAGEVSWFKEYSAKWFYKLFRGLSGLDLPDGAQDFFIVDAPTRRLLNQIPGRRRFMRGAVSWLPVQRGQIHYHPPARAAGRSKYSAARMARLAVAALYAFSGPSALSLALTGSGATLLGLTILGQVTGRQALGTGAVLHHVAGGLCTLAGLTMLVVAASRRRTLERVRDRFSGPVDDQARERPPARTGAKVAKLPNAPKEGR